MKDGSGDFENIKEMKRLEKELRSEAREIKRALSLLNEDCVRSRKPKRKETREIETICSDSETYLSLRESFKLWNCLKKRRR